MKSMVIERWKERDWVELLAPAVGALPWLTVTRGPYHFDDFLTPESDPASQGLGAWIAALPRTLRPLTKLTYALESSLGFASAAERRVTSIVLLAAVAIALGVVMRRAGVSRSIATFAAVAFAAHPVHEDTVLLLAGRGALLALLLSLVAIDFALRGRAWLSAGFLALAVASRETAVAAALPIAVCAAFEDKKRILARLEPLAVVVLLSLAWLALNHRYRELADYSFAGRPWSASVIAQVAAVPLGLSLYVRPGALSIDHGEDLPFRASAPLFWVGIATYVGFFVLALWAVRTRRRAVALGAALWIAAIAPTQSFVPKLDALTERPLGGALAGLALVACGFLAVRATPRSRLRLARFGAAVAALVAAFFVRERGLLFASDVLLWGDAAKKSVANARPHYELALALRDHGDAEAALASALRAREIDPFSRDIERLCNDLERN